MRTSAAAVRRPVCRVRPSVARSGDAARKSACATSLPQKSGEKCGLARRRCGVLFAASGRASTRLSTRHAQCVRHRPAAEWRRIIRRVAELLNSSPMVFPVLECFHILGFILLAGSIALIDFRLLVALMPDQGAARADHGCIALDADRAGAGADLRRASVRLRSGSLLFEPGLSVQDGGAAAGPRFHYTIHGRAVRPGASAGSGKLAACVSLALWAGVIGGGIFIGFVNGPE